MKPPIILVLEPFPEPWVVLIDNKGRPHLADGAFEDGFPRRGKTLCGRGFNPKRPDQNLLFPVARSADIYEVDDACGRCIQNWHGEARTKRYLR